MSTEDGAPSFLSSDHRDCDMKCSLSGAVIDNCDICAGNHTDCMIVVTIKPSAVPENMDYNITVHGAGFHQHPTPVCLYTRVSDSEEFNATMKVMDPSMGYCRANLEPGRN
ncbi:uncharacterized protein LOC135157616 isoform X2 [Lytechinus pictus]|uniref:uncharacterized protein LOC135157616 isoform X2 n=1 Tax=Lytechinus pictus TaxID=7653 RepID=UPI0030B9C1F7